MSKKKAQAKVDESQYVKKNSATVLAVVCLLGGVFLGFNISLFMDAGGKKQNFSVANTQPVQSASAPAPSFDFDALIAAAEANPGKAEGWVQLGNAYFDVGNHAESIKAYEKALKIDPGNANVLVDLGVMYRRHGQAQKAVESFDRANRVDPNHLTARFNKGIVLLHDLNNRVAALATWEELLRINPEYATPTGKHLHELVDEVKAGAM